MPDANPNAAPPADGAPPVDELAQLREFAGSVRKALALDDQADQASVLSTLGNVSKELSDTKARAASIETAWASEKVSGALRTALESSGIKPEFMEDAMLRALPLFTVNERGEVVTKADAKDTVPGQAPASWIVSEFRAQVNGRYWPLSQGAGSKSSGYRHADASSADSMFDPRSAGHSFTEQLRYEQTFGSAAADAARAKYRNRGKGFV